MACGQTHTTQLKKGTSFEACTAVKALRSHRSRSSYLNTFITLLVPQGVLHSSFSLGHADMELFVIEYIQEVTPSQGRVWPSEIIPNYSLRAKQASKREGGANLRLAEPWSHSKQQQKMLSALRETLYTSGEEPRTMVKIWIGI